MIGQQQSPVSFVLATGLACIALLACYFALLRAGSQGAEAMTERQLPPDTHISHPRSSKLTMFGDDALMASGLAGRFAIGSYPNSPDDDKERERKKKGDAEECCDCRLPPPEDVISKKLFVSSNNLSIFASVYPALAKELSGHDGGLEAIWERDYMAFYATEALMLYQAFLITRGGGKHPGDVDDGTGTGTGTGDKHVRHSELEVSASATVDVVAGPQPTRPAHQASVDERFVVPEAAGGLPKRFPTYASFV